ncbi:hypothetical protein LXL04_009929 [Taraxacum kok-saghyz]
MGKPAIGIDLGTTYSCVAVWKHDRIEIIPNDQGNRTTLSCVTFIDAACLIGDGAKNQAAMNPTNTIFDAKRLTGRRFSDSQVQHDMKLWPFKVIQGPVDTPKFVVSYKGKTKEFWSEEISSMVLRKMKETAEAYIGEPTKNAVITPTAAAIAYGLDNNVKIKKKKKKYVLVFDLRGGTFDVSILTIVEDTIKREFKKKWSNKDLTVNKKALGRLRCACEKAKRILSFHSHTSIELDGLHDGIDFSVKFTRAKFEELNMSYFDRCMKTVEACLRDAKVKKSKKELCESLNPDEAVAYGAARLAAKLTGNSHKRCKDMVLLDVTPLSLGIEIHGGIFDVVIPRNKTIPRKVGKIFYARYNHSMVNIKVYQGERGRCRYNHFLGMFTLSGIPLHLDYYQEQVNVWFEIDASNILTVTAEIVSTGKMKKLTITNANGRLSKEDIEKMAKDAHKAKQEDQEYKI